MSQLATISLGVIVVLSLAFERQAAAQGAWVEAQNSLSFGLNYNYAQSDKIIADSKLEFPDAGVRTQEATLRVEYVPLRHLAVDAQLPFVAIQYLGSKTLYPHRGGGLYDNGDTWYTPTDFRMDVRYQLLEDPVAFTPLIGFSAPVADYETVGNAVAGRHLDELHLGAAVGRVFGSLYLHLLYTFTFAQRCDYTAVTEQYGENHSDGAFRIGYKLLDDKLDVNLGAEGRVTHGGLNFDAPNTPAEMLYHDAILHEDIFLVGPGVGYQITNSVTVDLFARFFVTGLNTQNANVFGFGLTWSAL